MHNMEERLKAVLEKFCAGQMAAKGTYEIVVGSNALGRAFGVLTWDRFDQMEVTKRQKLLREFVQRELSPEERTGIGALHARGMGDWVTSEDMAAAESKRLVWK